MSSKRLIDIRWNWAGRLEKTVGNAERNNENRKQFRCHLRWLSQEIEWPTVARLPSSLFTRADVKKKSATWTSEAWDINWSRFPTTEEMVKFHVGQPERGQWQNSKLVLLLTVEPEMKCYFLTKIFLFVFFGRRSFQFSFFQFLKFWKVNFCGTLARVTSLYIRKTFRGSRATSGPRANTLATPAVKHLLDVHHHCNRFSSKSNENPQ